MKIHPDPEYKKKKIPKAMREALWIHHNPILFSGKCKTSWCPNMITAYTFQAGHNIPESKGGTTSLENLVPICSRCNLSMGNRYTFDEWCKLNTMKVKIPKSSWCCISAGDISSPVSTGLSNTA
jgi:hypothetical protein